MTHSTRRDFLALLSMLPLTAVAPAFAQQKMPLRRIPVSGESLPVIGLGSSKVVEEIAARGDDPLRQVMRTLVTHGGKVIDTWPRNPANDGRFGGVINEAEFRDRLFVTSKIDRAGKDAGIAQLRQAHQLYGRKVLDLAQIFSLTDVETHWPTLREWKDSGMARYIGVTVSELRRHTDLENFLKRERPDTVQVNYSITERESEERLIPLAADRGVAVDHQPAVHERRVLQAPRRPAAATVGHGDRLRDMGAVLAEVHPLQPPRHRRPHGDEQPEAHG